MLPAQKRNGLPKRKSATRTEISEPGPISLVIMVPRTEIHAVFSGDFGPAGPNSPGPKSVTVSSHRKLIGNVG